VKAVKTLSGKLFAVAGVALAVAGLLLFSLMAPGNTIGLETDIEPTAEPTDVAPTPEPTAVPPQEQSVDIDVSDAAPAVGDAVVLSVTVSNEDGSPVAGTDCTFSIVSQPGTDAGVIPGPVTTDANGIASTILAVGSTTGVVQVHADCGDASVSVSVVAGAAEEPALPPASQPGEPPASLPDAGNGGYAGKTGSAQLLLISLLAALGVTLAGIGTLAARHGRRVQGD
jgi:hypothetical protein